MTENKFSFTIVFAFQNGTPLFKGFTLETMISKRLAAKYRVLVLNPKDLNFYTIRQMEEPITQQEINEVIRKHYNGAMLADEFVFEVFDSSNKKIFATRFDAREKMPIEASNNKSIYTTYSWAFDLPENLIN